MVPQKPREIAARILLRHAADRAFIEDVLKRELTGVRLPTADRALIQELCYGTVRWRATLDWLIGRQARHRQVQPAAQALLRLGLYQLFWLDRVPDHAAVNETVEAARALDLGTQSGFINALLRNYVRDAEATRKVLQELRDRDPSLGWSHPAWMIRRWEAHLSKTELQGLLAWNNTSALTYARVNTLRTDAGQLIEHWRKEGVEYDFARWDWVPENVVFLLRRHPPLERLKTLQEGWFYLQDPSTLMAVSLLAPQPGEHVLDLCAAPGGKTTFIAQQLDNDGQIVAVEPDAKRRHRLRENCERLGADVQVVAAEAPEARGPFDAVLIDAPCSNTGVLRRRLEARWRLNSNELKRTADLQARLLKEALGRVRPGGRLVYSTCSLEPEENEEQITALAAAHPQVRLLRSRLLHPARDGVDGAFAALLQVDDRVL